MVLALYSCRSLKIRAVWVGLYFKMDASYYFIENH